MEEGTKKQSQGKECSYSGCSDRMYDAKGKKKHAIDFLHFQRMESFVAFGKTVWRESRGTTVSV